MARLIGILVLLLAATASTLSVEEKRQLIKPEVFCKAQPDRLACKFLAALEIHDDEESKDGTGKRPNYFGAVNRICLENPYLPICMKMSKERKIW
jgi:hypothetical protein